MLGIFKRKSVDVTEIIEMKKKIAYIETDMVILKTQYERLLSRYKVEVMTDARQKKKEDDIDIQKIIAEITANPNMSIQDIITKNGCCGYGQTKHEQLEYPPALVTRNIFSFFVLLFFPKKVIY